MLDDAWFLRWVHLSHPITKALKRRIRLSISDNADTPGPSADPLTIKWERRKRPSTAYAPSLRSGCTMALWQAKNMGILFGGVTDEDTNEETLESVFWNDLYACLVVCIVFAYLDAPETDIRWMVKGDGCL
jgi:hypothetical protein